MSAKYRKYWIYKFKDSSLNALFTHEKPSDAKRSAAKSFSEVEVIEVAALDRALELLKCLKQHEDHGYYVTQSDYEYIDAFLKSLETEG